MPATIQALAPRLACHREAVCALPGFEPTWWDELASLAAATRRAVLGPRLVWLPPSNRRKQLAALSDTEKTLRLALRLQLRAHGRGDDGFHPPGDRRVITVQAGEVIRLAGVLRTFATGQVGVGRSAHTPDQPWKDPFLTPDMLNRVEALAWEVLSYGTPPQRAPPELDDARKLRAQALSLLRAVFEEVRAGVMYVGRYAANIEARVPTFWAMRGTGPIGRGRKTRRR